MEQAQPAEGMRTIDRYVVLEELGRGATSTVYLARDPYRDAGVALKVYHRAETHPERADTRRKLFINEARLVGQLMHPNILPVLDAGESGEDAYIVTEYLRGAEPLSAHTRLADLLPQRRVVEILFACAKALDYAHRQGVVHRDIKPSNILLGPDGSPMLIDFGVAMHSLPGSESVTGLVGSPSYMAPEQVRNGTATALSDVYSLGVVGYELLTGQRPFRAESFSALVHQIMYATPRPIGQLRASVPSGLEAVIARAMEKDASRRYASALAMAADFARVRAELEKSADDLDLQDRFGIIRHMEFFRDFGYAETWETVSHSDWCNFDEAQVIVRAGADERCFSIVIAGELALERGDRQVSVLRRGAAFGDLELIYARARATTVRALTPALLMRVNAEQFESLSAGAQLAFYKRFNRGLLERFKKTRMQASD